MTLFKTFGMQNGDMLIFFLWPFRKVEFRKMQFLKDGVRTVVPDAWLFVSSWDKLSAHFDMFGVYST